VLADGGDELTVLEAGDFFGEFSLLAGTARQHDVEAAGDTELMVVPKDRFDALMAHNPELAESIRRKAGERLAANLGAAPG
jgi:CRP-like cAMP-binding protein